MLTSMSTELNDSALMLRYGGGDSDAFEALYRRYRAPLFGFLLRQVGNRQYAEDVFQETWSRIIRNRQSYRPTAQFSTYLYHVARNCMIDHYRKAGRRATLTDDDADIYTLAATDDPAASAEDRDNHRAFVLALRALPDEQREAFLLHEECGLTLDEISGATGAGRETVKSRLRYAVGKLRESMASSLAVRK